ncbi:MAG TPA: GrpB family protein [Caulobacteraceae bacterium]|nr:GrpB family protein [Caulobacteraceae bacterium]
MSNGEPQPTGQGAPDPYGLGLETSANRLVDYNPLWPRAFEEEAGRIRAAVGDLALAIEHYGSTAVPGLRAKPILDLLVGVADIDDGLEMVGPMAGLGYDYSDNHGIPEHHIFGRPTVRAYLVHVVVHGGDQWERCLRFRDRLRASADLRSEYQALKERLAREATSRAAYTDGKTAFVVARSV